VLRDVVHVARRGLDVRMAHVPCTSVTGHTWTASVPNEGTNQHGFRRWPCRLA
jgi:hypothetical protein